MTTGFPVHSAEANTSLIEMLHAKLQALEATNAALTADNRQLTLKVKDLLNRLYGKRSERLTPSSATDDLLLQLGFPAEVLALMQAPLRRDDGVGDASSASAVPLAPPLSASQRAAQRRARHRKGATKGPKPIDPSLPREPAIILPNPSADELICPGTGVPMVPLKTERLEVLARQRPVFTVKVYERTVWGGPAKTTPVYTAWPGEVFGKARMHLSTIAYLATAHYVEHLPFYRLEQQLLRLGILLPRHTQLSLMEQLATRAACLIDRLKHDVFASGYIHLDATPVKLCDPARPGHTCEATLWVYRAATGPVWFEFQLSKAIAHPHAMLTAMQYRGLLHTDGAPGLDKIGHPGQIVHLGCWAHVRRKLYEVFQKGDADARAYLALIDRLYRIEQHAAHFQLPRPKQQALRERYSLPLITALFTQAAAHVCTLPPRAALAQALGYLLNQRAPLERCLTTPGARLDNNPAENAIRPLKLGAKNWLFIGHPRAGQRLAQLFTLLENCRQAGIDPEAYLLDVIPRIPDQKMPRLGELLPHAWKATQAAQATSVVHAS
jgi:transposase